MATEKQIKEHIEEFAPTIQKYAKLYGYKVCSPIIAQSITESISSKDKSGWSVLKYKYHNMFGMKCGKNWRGGSVNLRTGEEYKPNIITMIHDNFRTFSTYEEGIQGYFIFTSSARYSKLKEADTPLKYLQELQKAGYATSSRYITTNMSHINKYNLTRYDNFSSVNTEVKKEKLPTLKLGMTDKQLEKNYIESWQNYLVLCGYAIEVNGVYTEQMFNAVRDYQSKNNLVADGIIGAKTWQSIPK